ncbi:MAG: hypothetical protein HCA25_19995 [Dolichospermum sp. DET50]|nr:hypothetical protein [Dolichospermum sp. DET66]MBS3034478.1 hypothetical protein [Dolichospermum sp. DET67]MBS3039681.1 hypothetical protein [Dolichospermum sp. DET50]QSX66889.1 MAG: hypothetical protein EZY12_19265 [Dolichospermum sp. DET69]
MDKLEQYRNIIKKILTIIPIKKRKYHFPTFKLDVKEEYLDREKIYEQ